MTGTIFLTYRSLLLTLLTVLLPIAYPVHLLMDHAPDEEHHEEADHKQEQVCSICMIYTSAEMPSEVHQPAGYSLFISDLAIPDCYLPEPLLILIPRAPPSS